MDFYARFSSIEITTTSSPSEGSGIVRKKVERIQPNSTQALPSLIISGKINDNTTSQSAEGWAKTRLVLKLQATSWCCEYE